MTRRSRLGASLVLALLAAPVLSAGCAKDTPRPPFVSAACTDPPCSAPTTHGGGAHADAGAGDATADAHDG